MHVVLVEPEIPPNTGNIARLCAATGSCLHLIEPLGFQLDDRTLKRAGMDYWQQVRWCRWPSWPDFLKGIGTHIPAQPGGGAPRLWFIEQGGNRLYSDVTYQAEDILVFGRETRGLSPALLTAFPDQVLEIPVLNPQARSLNLSNAVAIVLFEALRQLRFPASVPA